MRFIQRKLLMMVSAVVVTGLVVAACGGGGATATPRVIERTVVATPTAGPTPTARIIERTVVATPTAGPPPTAVPKTAGITTNLKGFRWLGGQGPANWRQAPKRGGTLVYAFPIPSAGTDPTLNRDFSVSTAVNTAYNKLFTCKKAPLMEAGDPGNCVPVGDLLAEWAVSGDGMEWTLKLQPDAVWHNIPSDARGYTSELSGLYGRSVTAADVVHTFNYWQGNLTKPDGDPQGSPSSLGFTGNLESFEAVDEKTIRVRTKVPDPFFPSTYAAFNARVVPPEVFNLDGDYTQRTVGSGAFMLMEFDRLVEWKSIANPDYFKVGADGEPLPYMDVYNVKVISATLARSGMITGVVDLSLGVGISGPASAVNFTRQCPTCQVIEYFLPANTSRILQFKVKPTDRFPNPAFADRRARLAIAKAIDYQGMIDNVFEGAAVMTPVEMPWGLLWDSLPTLRQMGNDLPDDENPFVYDPEVAKRLWAESGHSPGEKMKIIYHEYNATHTIYTVTLADSISKALDIDVEAEKVSGIPVLYTATGFTDPNNIQNYEHFVTITRGTGANNAEVPRSMQSFDEENMSAYDNPKIDAIAAEWIQNPTLERERELARALYTEVINDLHRMPAVTEANYEAMSGRVRNMYQQLRGGRCCHQGAELLEIIWLDD